MEHSWHSASRSFYWHWVVNFIILSFILWSWRKYCCWQLCTGTFKNIFYILPISARCQVHWKIIFSTFKMHLRLPEHCCKCNFIHKNLCLEVQFCVSIQENQFLWIRKCPHNDTMRIVFQRICFGLPFLWLIYFSAKLFS